MTTEALRSELRRVEALCGEGLWPVQISNVVAHAVLAEIDRLTRENAQLAEFVEAVGGFWGHTKSVLVGPESLAEAINGMAEENLRLTRERDEARAERDALRELLLFAGQELVCGCAGIDGDDPQDVGEGWQESHWCPRCDDSVDRNWELRTRIRAALAQTGANDVVTSNEGMKT